MLGSGGYDMRLIDAPAISGIALDFLSRMLARSRVGPWVRRFMLDNNGVARIRDLSSQIDLAPLYFPMVRVSDEEWHLADNEATSTGMFFVLSIRCIFRFLKQASK